MRPDGLDLHVRERLSHASVPAASEPDERRVGPLVLGRFALESLGLVHVGLGVHLVHAVRKRRGRGDNVPLGDDELLALRGLHLEGDVALPEEHDEGRVHPERLLDAEVELVHLGEDVEVDLVPVLCHHVLLLLLQVGEDAFLVGDGQQARPG